MLLYHTTMVSLVRPEEQKMYSTDVLTYRNSAPKLASGTTHYENQVGVVTQGLIMADINLVINETLEPDTVIIDLDCLPWWRRLWPATRLPRLDHDHHGNLRLYYGSMKDPYGTIEYADLVPAYNHIQMRNGAWRGMTLTITMAPGIRYANL